MEQVRRKTSVALQNTNKKLWEELMANETDHIENDVSNNSSVVAYVFVTAVTFLLSRCLPTIKGKHIQKHDLKGKIYEALR
jgi:hypothetical protein